VVEVMDRTRRLRVPVVVTVLVVVGLGLLVGVAALTVNGVADRADSSGESGSEAPVIPPLAMSAYVNAAAAVGVQSQDCTGMTWPILAGVGAVESGHAAGSSLADNGDVRPTVIGPRLDGSGAGGNITPVADTDDGTLDGDLEYDRAVGPMQFLPETWSRWGRDGNGDGTNDPHNIYDATMAAAAYLCGNAPADLADRAQLSAAIARYNDSDSYLIAVLTYADSYAAAPPS